VTLRNKTKQTRINRVKKVVNAFVETISETRFCGWYNDRRASKKECTYSRLMSFRLRRTDHFYRRRVSHRFELQVCHWNQSEGWISTSIQAARARHLLAQHQVRRRSRCG